jgi:uncharacterized protein GlcG (DUF336 family)
MMPRYLTLLALLPIAFASVDTPDTAQGLTVEGNVGSMGAMQAGSAITAAQAQAVIDAAVKKANEIKVPSNIAITDPAGHLVAFLRMDGAILVSIEVAQKKARTVSMFNGKYKTGDLYNGTFRSEMRTMRLTNKQKQQILVVHSMEFSKPTMV